MMVAVGIGLPALARVLLRDRSKLSEAEASSLPRKGISWAMILVFLIPAFAVLLYYGSRFVVQQKMVSAVMEPGVATLAPPEAAPPERTDTPKPLTEMSYHTAPDPGAVKPSAPAGADFTAEQQVVIPADSRVAVELFQLINDGERPRLGGKLVFKTPIDSGLGVLLRWHGYGPSHPISPNRWVLELIDPQRGVTFHVAEGRFPNPTRMAAIDGSAPGTGKPTTLQQSGTWAYLRLLRAEKEGSPNAPVRQWSEIQAFVTWIMPQQAGDSAEFQLPR
jgi:hypothetical protein